MAHEAQDSSAQKLWRIFKQTGCELTREKLIFAHQNLVRFLASKFNNRGIPLEDLVQVGNIGLINAVDRYDPERGTKFSTFATPTIAGEIRRYFRDKGWGIKMPRQLQELNQFCREVEEDLLTTLKRKPTVPEIANKIGISEEKAREALDVGIYYNSTSLEHQLADNESDKPLSLEEFLGKNDYAIDGIVEYDELRRAIASLDERARFIITHRFFLEESQTHVADQLGISQMHVSRLQEKAIKKIRVFLGVRSSEKLGQILLNVGKTRSPRSKKSGAISIAALKSRYHSTSRKKVRIVNENSATVMPIGLLPVAFWVFVAFGDSESGSLNLKVLSELIRIPHKQIYAQVMQTEKSGSITRAPDTVAGYRRGNSIITVSTTSKKSETEVGGIMFARGETYNLAQIADEYRSMPEAAEIIKRLTTVKKRRSSRSMTGAARQRRPGAFYTPTDQKELPTVRKMLQQLAQAVKFLAVEGFSKEQLNQVLEPQDIAALKLWFGPSLEPILPKGNTVSEREPSLDDSVLNHCLNAIHTICNDSCQVVASLYDLASKR